MSSYYSEIVARKEYLMGIINEKQKSLSGAPDGNIRVTSAKGYPRYYHIVKKGDTKGKYIRSSDIDLAKSLAQKDYDMRVLKAAKKELHHLNSILSAQKNSVETIYSGLGDKRQQLIIPVELTDEEFIRQWYESKKCETMGFAPESPVILTSEDERVRSKSEQLYANTLIRLGIPKVYEPLLFLKGRGWVRPDFAMLNVRERREVYGEHFGMMDDPQYARDAVEKLRDYERSGFVLGYDLIITMETRKYPLEEKKLEQLLKHHLL